MRPGLLGSPLLAVTVVVVLCVGAWSTMELEKELRDTKDTLKALQGKCDFIQSENSKHSRESSKLHRIVEQQLA